MTTSQAIRTATPSRARHGTAATIGIAIVAGTTVAGLFIAAITFAALAIAFPIAVPIAQQYRVPVAPSDVAIAQQFAAMWWVFGGLAVLSLVAAAAIVIKTVARFGPSPAA